MKRRKSWSIRQREYLFVSSAINPVNRREAFSCSGLPELLSVRGKGRLAEASTDASRVISVFANQANTSRLISSGRLLEISRMIFPRNKEASPFRSGAPRIRYDAPIVAVMSTIVSAMESLTA